MKKNLFVVLFTALFVLGSLGTSSALTMTFFGEDQGLGDHNGKLASHVNADTAKDSFLGNLVGVGTENFESIAAGTTTPLALDFAGAGTATLTGSGEVWNDTSEYFGRYAISGSHYLNQVVAPGFSIDFSQQVAAFGFYSTDIGDFSGTLTLLLANGISSVLSFPNTFTTGGSVAYFGYIDTDNPFTKITFNTTSGSGDAFGFDDFTIGSVEQVVVDPVPEPSTIILLGIGIAGLAFWRRKQQS